MVQSMVKTFCFRTMGCIALRCCFLTCFTVSALLFILYFDLFTPLLLLFTFYMLLLFLLHLKAFAFYLFTFLCFCLLVYFFALALLAPEAYFCLSTFLPFGLWLQKFTLLTCGPLAPDVLTLYFWVIGSKSLLFTFCLLAR